MVGFVESVSRLLARRHTVIKGYEHPWLVEVIYQKTLRLRDDLVSGATALTRAEVPVLAAIALVHAQQLRVVEFGGGCGGQYFRLRAALDGRFRSWLVVETPALVARAGGLEDGILSFGTELPGEADLIYSSGALQYAPDPEVALSALITIRAEVICLTRLHFGSGTSELQLSRLRDNGPGPLPPHTPDAWVAYTRTSIPRPVFEGRISPTYRTIADFDDGLIGIDRTLDRKRSGDTS